MPFNESDISSLAGAQKTFMMKFDKLRKKRNVGPEAMPELESLANEMIESGTLSTQEKEEAQKFIEQTK